MSRSPFEDRLAERLEALADRAPTRPQDRPAAAMARSATTRRWPIVAAAVVVVVAAVSVVVAVNRTDSTDLVSTGTDGSSRATTQSTALVDDDMWGEVGASWEVLPAGPADGRVFPVSIWTGTQLIIWGGESMSETTWTDTGASYDPKTGQWQRIAQSPLSPRSEHTAVWTGTEMIVCCGRTPNSAGGNARSAAAYDPAADSWRALAAPPVDTAFPVSVWTGTEMIVTGGIQFGGVVAYRGAVAYNPTTDTWRELADPPRELERSADAAWTGERMIVWPHVFGATPGMVYDPQTDTWSTLPDLPPDLDAWGASMVWTGSEIIIWGNSRLREGDAVGARIGLDAAEWEPIADDLLTPFDWSNGIPGSNAAVWTGTEMAVWTGAMGEDQQTGSTRTLAYNPQTDAWRELPATTGNSFHPEMIWTGEVALLLTSPVVAIRP